MAAPLQTTISRKSLLFILSSGSVVGTTECPVCCSDFMIAVCFVVLFRDFLAFFVIVPSFKRPCNVLCSVVFAAT
uniref:Putative ovule protein n=1 Tax=Solanum chacoense TaxID=4108 RepID=A0A0V0GEJ1_SOLCH